MAQEQWTDLYLRHNFQDTGLYPTAGSLSASPDLIPLGANPISDPQDLITDANWKKDYGSSTDANRANYIYMRGQNLGDTETEGQLYLYYSPGSLLLWPTDPVNPKKGWATRPLQTSFGEKFQTVKPKAKERFATKEGFLWIPEPIANDHYCLVGRVVTAKHPNPIPEVGTLRDFALYISEHPDMAWRNVVTINPSNPVSSTMVDYSQGSVGGDVYVILRCENVPDGSRVEFSSGTPGPDPMIYMNGTVANVNGRYNLTLLTNIPADFTTNITYTWFSEGKVPLPGMKIWLDAILPVPENDDVLGPYSRPLSEFGIAPEAIPHAGPRRGTMLGTSNMETLPVAVNGPSPRRYGSRAAADAGAVLFSGVAWGNRYSSIFGSTTQNIDVAVIGSVVSEVPVETVTVSDSAQRAVAGDTADLWFDTVIDTGSYSGSVMANLTATNVPVGCDIWFQNLDGDITIAVAPTRVTSSKSFVVSALVDDLPADYTATIRSYLKLNGNTLPGTAQLVFALYSVVPGEMDANGAPKPGKLLGRVTLTPRTA